MRFEVISDVRMIANPVSIDGERLGKRLDAFLAIGQPLPSLNSTPSLLHNENNGKSRKSRNE